MREIMDGDMWPDFWRLSLFLVSLILLVGLLAYWAATVVGPAQVDRLECHDKGGVVVDGEPNEVCIDRTILIEKN